VAGGAGGAAVGGTTMWDKLHNNSSGTNQPQGSVHSGTLAGTGSGYSDDMQSQSQATTAHHYGRDAAVGGGALGAAGLAEHEHRRHEGAGSTTGTQSSSTGYPSTTGTSSTAHPSTTGTSSTTGEHHYGRDATLGGSALGAAGLALFYRKIRWRKVRAPLGRVPGNAWEA